MNKVTLVKLGQSPQDLTQPKARVLKSPKSPKSLKIITSSLGDGVGGKEESNLDGEAKQIEGVLQKSFGSVTTEFGRREKASDGLMAVSAHWTDGDAKRLVISLAHRYGARLKFSKHDLKKPSALTINNSKNSVCNSAKLKDLDWDRGWWTDDSFGMHYLHVHHKDGETIHRVYCKGCQQPRIEQRKGKLYWLYRK